MIISTFNSAISNIDNITTQHQQIMTTIRDRFLKLKPMIKIKIVANYLFFRNTTFNNINSFTYLILLEYIISETNSSKPKN